MIGQGDSADSRVYNLPIAERKPLEDILDGGSAETDIILNSRGFAGHGSGSTPNDPFFLYTPSGASSTWLNMMLSGDLSRWKWKPASCSGAVLQTLGRSGFVPNGGYQPNAQYTVATLLHIRYTIQKDEDEHYTITEADITFTPGCKDVALMFFEFRGAYATVDFPGPTLACKGKNIYEYVPQKPK